MFSRSYIELSLGSQLEGSLGALLKVFQNYLFSKSYIEGSLGDSLTEGLLEAILKVLQKLF